MTFWGKLKRAPETDAILAWHPLVDHCADVSACCEAILTRSLISRRLAALAGSGDDLTPSQIARLSVLAALHDIGKFNRGFQNKALVTPPFVSGHVNEALAVLFGGLDGLTHRVFEALRLQEILAWGDCEGMCQLLMASISHHGKPGNPFSSIHREAWQVRDDFDPFLGLRDLGERVREWFPLAFDPAGDHLPSTPAFQHAFSGLVMLADWLGSDADEKMFRYTREGDGDRMAFARERAMRAVGLIGLDVAAARHLLGDDPPGFDRVSEHPPRPQQRALAEAPISKSGSVVILEAETGAGKTEAALAHFLRLFQADLVDGMYFALPTRTAATEIHSRVTKALARAFSSDEDRPVTVLAVPGYIAADDKTAKRLPGFQVLWNDDPAERYRYRGWAAENSKRYLAAAAAVGTIDQALFASLRVGHAHLRSTALLRHLLVVDEVHASDIYMTRLLEEVLRRHVAAGGHALLMSATLGASAKHRLLKACGDRLPLPSLDEARELSYPSILVKAPGADAVYVEVAPPSATAPAASKSVRTELLPSIDDPEAIARRALEMARDGAKVLVIRNTVSGCLAVQQALEQLAEASGGERLLFRCKRIAAPHHSRYARDDRKALDLAIEASFGKHRPEGGLVAVATQTVQQSLDLDADVMLSDLCPMDVLLQRVGRLFRHDRKGRRPAGFESPRLLVLVPETRDLSALIRKGGKASPVQGLGSVYDDLRVVEATWRLLETYETLEIPQMNRELVEGATHPNALDNIAAPGDPKWYDHEALVVGATSAKHGQAVLNLFEWETPFDETEFPSGDTSRRIASRLGADDRRIVFEPPPIGPFGAPVEELSIPNYWIGEATGDLKPILLNCEPNGFGFEIQGSSSRFQYDRHGLARCG